MKNRKTYAISSYQELTEAKVKLRSKINEQVFEITNNKIVRFASFLTDGEKKDDSVDRSLASFDVMELLKEYRGTVGCCCRIPGSPRS